MRDRMLPESQLRTLLLDGQVIPAHPLALTAERKLDEVRQRALTRYYLAAGAGGVAVGVHTTQFAIRESSVGLLRPVLELAAETVTALETATGRRVVKVAGVCGRTPQAVREAELARELGYDAGLLSLAALRDADEAELIAHCRAVAEVIPLFGFYLQPSVGGCPLSYAFWRRFVEIPQVVAIKVAPFDRYATLDLVRAVAHSGRAGEVALYTGNDDNILLDLLSEYRFKDVSGNEVKIGFAGGLLGHWAVWTRRAVEQLEAVKRVRRQGAIPTDLLVLANEITDANAVFFDPAHRFAGCIAGLHEVLRRQGLLDGVWLLNESECLSPGQADEIDRVYAAYPHLNDDTFVAEHRDEWLV
jgi:hypothetical protein